VRAPRRRFALASSIINCNLWTIAFGLAMSQPVLPHPQSSPASTRASSTKSSKPALAKTLKHAFTRRKRSGSLRNGTGDDFDISSQRSGSIGPESFMSKTSIPEEAQMSEEVILNSHEARYSHPMRQSSIISKCTCPLVTLIIDSNRMQAPCEAGLPPVAMQPSLQHHRLAENLDLCLENKPVLSS
jgi:hypothetical protein